MGAAFVGATLAGGSPRQDRRRKLKAHEFVACAAQLKKLFLGKYFFWSADNDKSLPLEYSVNSLKSLLVHKKILGPKVSLCCTKQ
jgi:hypothetical protein